MVRASETRDSASLTSTNSSAKCSAPLFGSESGCARTENFRCGLPYAARLRYSNAFLLFLLRPGTPLRI